MKGEPVRASRVLGEGFGPLCALSLNMWTLKMNSFGYRSHTRFWDPQNVLQSPENCNTMKHGHLRVRVSNLGYAGSVAEDRG